MINPNLKSRIIALEGIATKMFGELRDMDEEMYSSPKWYEIAAVPLMIVATILGYLYFAKNDMPHTNIQQRQINLPVPENPSYRPLFPKYLIHYSNPAKKQP